MKNLKVKICAMLLATVLLSVLLCAQPIKIYIDGNQIPLTNDTGSPIITNNTTLVPIRVISEYLGYEVKWEPAIRKVTVKGINMEIALTIGSKVAYVNGVKTTLLAAPMIKDNRTYVPFRFIGETFKYTVKWDQLNQIVIFRSPGYEGADINTTKPTISKDIREVLTSNAYLERAIKIYGENGKMMVSEGTIQGGVNIQAVSTKDAIKILSLDWTNGDKIILQATANTSTLNHRGVIIAPVQNGVIQASYQSSFLEKDEDGVIVFTLVDGTDFKGIEDCEQLLFYGSGGQSVLIPNPLKGTR